MGDDFMDLLGGQEPEDQPDQDEKGMGDLLGSLLGGGSSGGMGDLLGGLLGGGGATSGGASGDMGDLLGSLMGGGGAGSSAGGTGDMAGMLGGLMGGGSSSESAGGLGGLLGGLLGGGAAGGSQAGGMGGLLGGLLGGGGDQMSFGGGGGMSLPFASTLAEKLGISEQMANMLIMGAIGLLTSSVAKNRSAGRSGAVDVNSLTDPDFIRSSGVAGRLSGQMGISEDDAILGLQQTVGLMVATNQSPPAKAPAKKKTAKKSTAAKNPAAPKKATAQTTKTKPKKKPAQPKTEGSDFMDLLDDANR